MIIISYDFSNDKKRTKFSKFLKRYGHSIQYSVYTIKNSRRVLNIILAEIKNNYEKFFDTTDSILIFKICKWCHKSMLKYGNAVHEDEDIVYLGRSKKIKAH